MASYSPSLLAASGWQVMGSFGALAQNSIYNIITRKKIAMEKQAQTYSEPIFYHNYYL